MVKKYLIPSLGKIPLTKLRPEHIQRFYAEKLSSGRANGKGGLSARTVRYMHVTLHKALKNAVKMGMIFHNPADAVEVPKQKSREMQIMNESDIHIFLEYAKEYTLLCFVLHSFIYWHETLRIISSSMVGCRFDFMPDIYK